MALDAGSRIAQYRLERKLGAGGMGEVYLARDEKLNRLVAIKLLTAADEGAKRRLAREARAAAGLDHPGICAVYEVGSDDVVGDFIAMQYIEGETLAGRLRRSRMSADEAMSIGAQIAEALVAAHRHGLVHRDLKPQNVIITPTGSARLLDFGLALHVPTTTEAANAITSSRVTDPNTVLGTPSYMSPEQVRNEPADFRSDVFSLGCVLYECLTGTRAFNGATTAEVLGAILHVEPPPVSSVAKNLGPAYDATCARMLEKVPSERFQSAEEALGAIRALTPSLRVKTDSLRVSARRPRSRLLRIAVAAGIAIAAFFGWQWYQRSALPVPPASAKTWYDKGVEAMRDGAFLGARDAFTRATQLFSGYSQVYSRLAEANTALDDEQAAQRALLGISGLIQSRWPEEEKLRFEAARFASVRKYADAIGAYRQLVNIKPNDAGRWVDLGRALETSPITPRSEALKAYERATELDSQYAAGHLRRGVMLPRVGRAADGLESIDTAIRLYRLAQRTEGLVEASLRKAIVLADSRRYDEARALFEEVIQLATTWQLPAQRLRAQFGLAKLAYNAGLLAEAESMARQAVDAASEANLKLLSATGLTDLGVTLMGLRRYVEADAQFLKAIEIAKEREARRVELRAKLQRGSMLANRNKAAEAVVIGEEALKHFAETEDARLLMDSKNVLSRGYEGTERYAEARALTEEVLRFAEANNDNVSRGYALENLAGQLTALGDFPEALKQRERLCELDKNSPTALTKHLANTAELLINLGRSDDARQLLRKLDDGIAGKLQSYVQRRPRVEQLRTLQAAIERRWPDVVKAAEIVEKVTPPLTDDGTVPDVLVFSKLLSELAKAHLGISRTPLDVIAGWPAVAMNPMERREWTYWVALVFLARGDDKRAEALALDALSAPGIRDNPEQGWRFAAVAGMAAGQRRPSVDAALANRKNVTPIELEKLWGPAAATYFARPDLTAILKGAR